MVNIFDSLKKKSELLILLVMGLALFIVVCAVRTVSTGGYNLAFEPGDRQERNFVDTRTGKKIEEDRIRVRPTEAYIIKTNLSSELGNGYTIGFFDPGFHTIVYISDKVIYESGKGNENVIGKDVGSMWHSIPLYSDMSSKPLTIVFINDTDMNKSIDMRSFYIGTESDIRSALTRASLPGVCIGFICLIITICLGIFSYVLYRSGYKEYYGQIHALSLLTIAVGIYVVADGNILQLLFDRSSSRYMCGYISFMLIPVFGGMYFDHVFGKDIPAFKIINCVYELAVVAECILYATGALRMYGFIYVIRAVILIELLAVANASINIYRRSGDSKLMLLAAGFLVAVLFYIGGMCRAAVTSKSDTSVYMGIGYLVFIGITLVTQVNSMFRYYSEEMRNREYKRISRVDSLTGGNSSEVAVEWLEENAKDEAPRNTFLHMVVNDFTSINVTLGWVNGNEIIKQIYDLSSSLLRDGELVCALSGASFALILEPGRNVENLCKELTTVIRMYLEAKFGREVFTIKYASVSIDKGDSLPDLLDRSAIAFDNRNAGYDAGSNCYYYNEQCSADIKYSYDLETRIGQALQNGEFMMYLQPKVNPANNEMVGAESLVRWVSSHEGMISPATFIPIAERSNQIIDIDLYMFRKVCKYIVDRKEQGLNPITISVNLSKYDIQNDNFYDEYEKIMEEAGITGENIEFEFAESTAFESMDKMEKIIDQIHRSGATVAMDDFGSANSNIAAISRLRFDIVKMDRTFLLNGFPENRHDYILIRDLIKMFHNMAIEVVCEGVETRDQRDALAELMCDQVQGFYYCRPLPEKEFNEYETI